MPELSSVPSASPEAHCVFREELGVGFKFTLLCEEGGEKSSHGPSDSSPDHHFRPRLQPCCPPEGSQEPEERITHVCLGSSRPFLRSFFAQILAACLPCARHCPGRRWSEQEPSTWLTRSHAPCSGGRRSHFLFPAVLRDVVHSVGSQKNGVREGVVNRSPGTGCLGVFFVVITSRRRSFLGPFLPSGGLLCASSLPHFPLCISALPASSRGPSPDCGAGFFPGKGLLP